MKASSWLQWSIWTTQRDRSMELLEKAGMQHALCREMPVEMARSVTQTSRVWASLWRVDDTLDRACLGTMYLPSFLWCNFSSFTLRKFLQGTQDNGSDLWIFFFFSRWESVRKSCSPCPVWALGGGGVGEKVETRRPEVIDLGSDGFPFFLSQSLRRRGVVTYLNYCFLKPSNLWVGQLVTFLSYHSAKSAPSWDEENHKGISGQLKVEWYI